MLSKKLVGTLGVLTAAALAPATVAHAAPKPAPADAARVVNLGTQVGSEGIRSPHADGIIAILIGVVSGPVGEPPRGHLVQGREGGVHGCPACPHPAAVSIAGDGIGVSYRLRSSGTPSAGAAPASQIVPGRLEYPNLDGSSKEPAF